MKIGIRQARIILTIHETGSVTKAARTLNRAQTSVTKALQNLEQSIDITLFDRSSKGVDLTPFGSVLIEGARQALEVFRQSADLLPPIKLSQSPATARFFDMDVSEKWLDAFLATVEHKNISAAAEALALSPAAISSSLRKFEDCLDTVLFERTVNGLVPAMLGIELASHIKLAKNILRHSLDEINSMRGNHSGSVNVGTLPLVRTQILPQAIIALLESHPLIDISTTESSYPELRAELRCGDVDFVLGALRGLSDDEDIVEETLFEDPLSIVVRAGHPLTKVKNPNWGELLNHKWILPRHGTPTRALFEQVVKANGESIPEHVVETSSFVTLRGMLMNSDRLTVLSRRQVVLDEEFGMLKTLPVELLADTLHPIGITLRKRGTIAPVAQLLIEEIRKNVSIQ